MSRISGRKKFCDIVKGLLTRLIFLLHGALSLYLLYRSNTFTKIHILFAIPMGCLCVEGFITLFVRKGKEMKYVWPCGFLYIATIVPMVWVLELDLLESRQGLGAAKNTTVNATAGLEKRIDELVLDALKVSDMDSRKFCEIGVIIGLIVGRWLSPRTFLSRNQLSALLLGYVSNAADILELFESLKAPDIVFHTAVTMAILAVYTWALLQFAFVTTATSDWRKERSNAVGPSHEVVTDIERNNETVRNPRHGQINYEAFQENNRKEDAQGCVCFKCHPEHFQILVTLVMQDGPFLLLRLILSIQFKVLTELHIFFLCKNAVVCILLVHRLFVLACDDDDEGDALHEYENNSKVNVIDLDERHTPQENNNIVQGNSDADKKEE